MMVRQAHHVPDQSTKEGSAVSDQDRDSKMLESAKKFESYFVGFVFQKAYESIPKSDLLGNQEQMFTGMFIENVSEQIAKSPHGLGLADQIYRQMKMNEGEGKSLSQDSGPPLKEALGRDGLKVNPEAVLGIDFAQSDLGALKGLK